MDLIPAITITGDALDAEKTRMEVISENIAHAQTTRRQDGDAYHRKEITFESYLDRSGPVPRERLRIAAVEDDPTPGRRIYMPEHPHADDTGMVEFPNVQLSREMVDLITASRSYEANLTILQTSKQMAEQAMSIGR